MKELILRPPHVTVYHKQAKPWCQVDNCERTATGTVVWLSNGYTALNCNDICGWHRFRMKPSGGLYYPLGMRPPLEQILHAVNQELMRRQRPVYQSTFSYAFNGTTSGTFHWRG